MLEFVEQMTLKAYELKETNAAELRQHGFTDEDILDIAHITGFFNHINRVADALGIDLEDFMLQGRGIPKV
ncbi:MAG: peroxidase [Caldithrix sp.]|nr:MAG: peroxidase [Caldithrix sp.]